MMMVAWGGLVALELTLLARHLDLFGKGSKGDEKRADTRSRKW
jgi:hypothetical protein